MATKKRPVIALVGRPNVGKSTLFNRLAHRAKAIVDNIPGVTRDRLYADIDWEGRPITIVDTGGFAPPDEETPILPQVVAQCQKAMQEADVIIFMTDARSGLMPVDKELMRYLRQLQKPFLVAVNKIDSEKQEELLYDFYALGIEKLWPISAIHGHGIYELMSEVVNLIPTEEALETEEKVAAKAIKVALVGRPNVGKSFLFNQLIGDERSVVSDIPGTTRDTIDTLLQFKDKTYLFMDTAGLRRKSRIKFRLEKFSVRRALRAIENTDIALVIIEAPEGITDQDLKIIGYTLEHGKCVLVGVNKWDLMPTSAKFETEYIEAVRSRLKFAPFIPIITFSALKKEGIEKLFPLFDTLFQEYVFRVSTGRLNRFLEDILAKYQLPFYRNRPVKFYYAAQVKVKPPTFVFFTNYPQAVPENYKRYLMKGLRQLGFRHVPIRLIFRSRTKR
ncbi:MAG: ribosome biogenesis GTPase Der [Candidatus Desulfofervidaceae bacterium]|nr:ribosome biogenesis GTPase Der [Candidatus Desulfofervidaceae bacterium]